MQAIHATLKQRHRATREGMPQALNLRIHRAALSACCSATLTSLNRSGAFSAVILTKLLGKNAKPQASAKRPSCWPKAPPELLELVFQRIYTLRNQLEHGGATWNSQINRAQVKECAHLMGELVPVVIDVMLSRPEAVWGEACYPVVSA